MKNVAKLIKEKREERKLTSAQVANFLGLNNYQSIHNWEKEKQAVPLAQVGGLCKVLKIPKKLMKTSYLLDMEIKYNKGIK